MKLDWLFQQTLCSWSTGKLTFKKFVLKLLTKIKETGVLNSIKIFINLIVLKCFDLRYKTDTFRRVTIESLHIDNDNRKYAAKYDPSPIYRIKMIFRTFKPTKNDIFIDIGSGKGLTLLIASKYCFKKMPMF